MAAAIGDVMQRYPLLRLLILYIGGILLADVLYPHLPSLVSYAAWGTLTLLLALLVAMATRRTTACGLLALLLFLSMGMWSYAYRLSVINHAWPSGETVAEARVLSEPRARRRSTLCEVEVCAVRDSVAWHRVGRKVFAYMEPCAEADSLLPGDIICFRGKLQAPRNFTDSLTFDYARYVTLQGASATVYLPRSQWRRVGQGQLTLRDHMLRLRQRGLRQYLSSSFEADALGVLSALTLGDKRALSTELREAYSNAGVAHVLALSGMHVGIIYVLLNFLLGLLLRRRGLRWVRELVIIVVLWSFALMVGLSPSVVRAVAMCTLYALAQWLSGDRSSGLHVLMLTALVMLLVDPFLLFDVGFQLSFAAMASILSLMPRFELLIRSRAMHPVLAYLVSTLCMTLAAQLGTFPLVLYHFGTFPTYFLVTNLLVPLILPVLMSLMLMWWGLTLMGCSWAHPLGMVLQWFVELLNGCLLCVGQWPGAVLRVSDYGVTSLLMTYLVLLLVVLLVARRWNLFRV
ncbi:MAG: ComEC/Rec2 family competence protein [Bacteroidaceae bacterium]|nr:ComEC/Rec2 family competence protein [Bacteroidaceae bacterium]